MRRRYPVVFVTHVGDPTLRWYSRCATCGWIGPLVAKPLAELNARKHIRGCRLCRER